ncbi:MAG: helix-turn-helix transcriptional regulator [Chloroflexi bacterium]|nr:helix-turn-helix transcriptional regulator [Chloroflexota bacterium]
MKSGLDRLCDSEWVALANRARFNAHTLAKLCGGSLRQLERYFLWSFGRPPQEWLDELRLCAANPLLLEQEGNKQVASRLGFANASHFIREFKRYHGCTPAKFVEATAVRSVRKEEFFTGHEFEDEAPESLRFNHALNALFSIHRLRRMGNHTGFRFAWVDCERHKTQ